MSSIRKLYIPSRVNSKNLQSPITIKAVRKALCTYANPEKAKGHQRFFKTGKGQYAEGDQFIGVTVPQIRKIVAHGRTLEIPNVLKLLASKIHEERLLALLILVSQFKRSDAATQERIVDAYLANLRYVNNWDLVDSSAHYILGASLYEKKRTLLYKLARSTRLWDRRIAIIATFYFIKHGDFEDTLKLAARLIKDSEDLMHKAVGWMLREVGKKDYKVLEKFLHIHYKAMPRTMLRSAIERFPETQRVGYLHNTI